MLFAVLQLAQNIRWWKWTSKVSPTHWLALIAAILLGAITVYILLYLPLFQHPPSTEPNPGFQIRSDDRMIPAVKGYQTEPTSTKEQVSAFCMPIREVLAWREWWNDVRGLPISVLLPDLGSTFLSAIELHCREKEPDSHKAEIVRLLKPMNHVVVIHNDWTINREFP